MIAVRNNVTAIEYLIEKGARIDLQKYREHDSSKNCDCAAIVRKSTLAMASATQSDTQN